MKYTWTDLHKKFVVKNEQKPKAQVTLASIYYAVSQDADYKFMLTCLRGDIYRYADDGSVWAVYLRPSKGGKKRRALWNAFENMKLDRVQTGDFEAVWKFPAEKLEEVATVLKVRRRNK